VELPKRKQSLDVIHNQQPLEVLNMTTSSRHILNHL
jgi:hypothetical protein